MNWHQLAENPQSLDNLYTIVPALENLELYSINLSREGSQIQICFNLPAFPDKPSARWHKDYNTVQIQLAFWGVTKFVAQGWQSEMKIKIGIKPYRKLLEVLITSPEVDLKFSFLSELLRIEKISPYQIS